MSKAKPTQDKTHKPAETAHHPKQGGTEMTRSASAGSSAAQRHPDYGLSRSYASPFSFMRRFSEEMDRLFDDFGFGSLGAGSGLARHLGGRAMGAGAWSPQVEMFEREGQLVVRADLPGLTKDDVNVDIDDDRITIHGERHQEHEEKHEGYYHTERSYGSFSRTIPLPEGVSAEDAKATFRNGVLEITMDAPRKPSGRRIQIEDTGEG